MKRRQFAPNTDRAHGEQMLIIDLVFGGICIKFEFEQQIVVSLHLKEVCLLESDTFYLESRKSGGGGIYQVSDPLQCSYLIVLHACAAFRSVFCLFGIVIGYERALLRTINRSLDGCSACRRKTIFPRLLSLHLDFTSHHEVFNKRAHSFVAVFP